MNAHPKTFRIVTLGCRTNQYESEALRHELESHGFVAASDCQPADYCFINTCTVTHSADSHSRQQIRQITRNNPEAEVIVTGCMAERDPEGVQSIEGVTHVIPNAEKEGLVSTLFPDLQKQPEFSISRFEAHTRAFVKVQDGCNSFCSYCIIPYVRGRSRSRSIDTVVKEVRNLTENDYKEIVLTGINVGDFNGGKDNNNTLADLVRAVDAVPGLERLRISSIDPDDVDDNLIDAILQGQRTCRSLHIVLQSGSNVVLKRMNRSYTRQVFLNTIDRLKNACPDFTITTDVIVGFPGETERDFEETLEVMREIQFAKVHMFPYSDRPRTRAVTYPDKISDQEKQRRKREVLQLAEKSAYNLREQFLGRKMTILTETGDSNRPLDICGHTDNFLMVWIPASDLLPNTLVEVELVENTPLGFIGKVRNTK